MGITHYLRLHELMRTPSNQRVRTFLDYLAITVIAAPTYEAIYNIVFFDKKVKNMVYLELLRHIRRFFVSLQNYTIFFILFL